jgi:hypothetical protein
MLQRSIYEKTWTYFHERSNANEYRYQALEGSS